MREADFLNGLLALLHAPVSGLDADDKLRLIREACDATEVAEAGPVRCAIVPFTPGRRPTDEAAHPGLGSSDNAAMLLPPGSAGENATYLLYTIDAPGGSLDALRDLAVDVTLSFCGTDGARTTAPIPGWNRRPVTPAVFDGGESDPPALQPVAIEDADGRRLVLKLHPAEVFLPGDGWNWDDADPELRASATDGADPFTFGDMFTQMLLVHLRVTRDGMLVGSASASIDVCDTRRFGSLYKRILDQLVAPDTNAQARRAGLAELDPSYHPWSPVLLIGSDKAALYTHALIEDIVYKKHHLTDPRWLMRVGLYLEMLTCIGVFEAVKDEVGDLLTPQERTAYETSPAFAEIRRRVNPHRWHDVWKLREIAFPKFGEPQTGPVSALNLLHKRKAVLAFLHVHHQDLKQAIELAGANPFNSQETWGRVFRDAERAVLRKTPVAFPELAHLTGHVKDVVLWHRQGRLGFFNVQWLPKHFEEIFGDQDGLFAAACNQYRSSMNEVATWAKRRGFMDHTGSECVPTAVSLLEAYMSGHGAHLERLQSRDGYTDPVQTAAVMPPRKHQPGADPAAHLDAAHTALPEHLFGEVPLFRALSPDERLRLAKTARTITLGPYERVIVQGHVGTSLFLVAEGRLDVVVRQEDDTDQVVHVLERGDTVGEVSLLTGEPRTATVRAIEGAVVYEIGREQFEPIIRARPELIDELGAIMKLHRENLRAFRDAYEVAPRAKAANGGLRRLFANA